MWLAALAVFPGNKQECNRRWPLCQRAELTLFSSLSKIVTRNPHLYHVQLPWRSLTHANSHRFVISIEFVMTEVHNLG